MTDMKITAFLSILGEIVNERGFTWNDKKRAIAAVANSSDMINLQEFAAWFHRSPGHLNEPIRPL